MSFLGINYYYINWDWKYCEKLIGFESVLDTHTSQNLADIVERVLTNNRLLADLLAITTDNAGNNNMMQIELADALKQLHNMK